ncbi:sensor domain-containing diguanylate cyclase [Ralstonia pickettii]|uniref:sensor domain-containing diguanylate cyclase n=1 Tax=Ralstonia pickettii TaxID=329 RepID=UPI000818B9E0|nr:sensor domain-containing diguanylate cyclase [Ralstonia pickettii]NWK45520.1 GGDEF domain-containing protein [Ralstonia pickettii]OCS44720.1 diguanylate cyclase [Ralstonia pickettii]
MVHPKVVTTPHTGDISVYVVRLTGLESLDPLAHPHPPMSIDHPPLQNPATLLEIVRAQSQIAKLGTDLGAIMALVTERAQHLTCATGAVVEMAEGDEMVYRATSGLTETLLGLRLARQGSLSGLCVQTGEILHCTDSETDPRVDREACRRVGLRSMVVTPLRHLDTTVGVLKLVAPEVDAFSASDIGVLELMSELIASAMFHAANAERDQLYLRATHDALTDLPNRALFYDRLRQSIHLAQRAHGGLGVLNIDMDNLKLINDRHGHRAGDAAIRETAQRMGRTARRSDTVARVGGDEFAVLLPGIGARADAQAQSERLIEEVQQPYVFEGQPLDLRVSVGIAVMPEDGTEITTLLDQADREMYSTKRERKQAQLAH